MELMMGFLGGLAMVVPLGAGVLAGWKLRDALGQRGKRLAGEPPDETQLRRLREAREALEMLGGYSPEMAYGMGKEERP